MCREEIVSNGCSGGCCEKFTLPVLMEDLHKMKAEHARVKKFKEEYRDVISNESELQIITCANGYERRPVFEDEVDKLIDMLIPLGFTAYDPQEGDIYNKRFEYDPSLYSLSEVHQKTYGHYLIKNEQILGMIYTCKHFDKENKVCTNYENRPQLCKNFGSNCRYQGCGYVKKLEEAEAAASKEWASKFSPIEELDCSEVKTMAN